MGQPRGRRYTLTQTDACRAKIKSTLLIGRLSAHAMGEIELSPTQVRSIEILLSKTLPSLTAQELSGGVANYVARLPSVAPNAEAWAASIAAEKPTEPRTGPLSPDPVVDGTKH